MKQRIISMITALAACLSLLPGAALAWEEELLPAGASDSAAELTVEPGGGVLFFETYVPPELPGPDSADPVFFPGEMGTAGMQSGDSLTDSDEGDEDDNEAAAVCAVKVRDDLEMKLIADEETVVGGGRVTLTLTGLPEDGAASVFCDKPGVTVTPGTANTWTAVLPNEDDIYRFTVSLDGNNDDNAATASCTVTARKTVEDNEKQDVHLELTVFPETASGGGDVILTLTGLPEGGAAEIICSGSGDSGDSRIAPKPGPDHTWLVTLPNAEDTYTFTAVFDGDETYNPASATVEASFAPVETPPAETTAAAPEPHTERDCPSQAFTDLNAGGWYHEAVDFALQNGLMNGSGTRFEPDAPLSRAMIAQILWNRAGRPAPVHQDVFSDVPDDRWFAEAVHWAAFTGVVSGYSDRRFGPNDGMTREQLVVLLWRSVRHPDSAAELPFSDADAVSGFAKTAMRWAVETGVLSGSGGALDPAGPVTRAQAAQMLKNFLETF